MPMTYDDAVLARALLVAHGWTAYHYFDDIGNGGWYVTAYWPPAYAVTHDMGIPDAGWLTIHSPREAVGAVCLYSAREGRGTA